MIRLSISIILKEDAMKTIYMVATGMLLILAHPLGAVEYGGEKSYLFETKYQVCIVPPQVDEAKAKGIKVINLEEAKNLFDQNARFFDAREARHFNRARIKGAYPVTFDHSKAHWLAMELPKAKKDPIVFYCYGESCANSYEAALAVRENGYENVHWFLNGFEAWIEHGYPIVDDR